VKKGRHRRFEEARALKRTVEVVVEPCAECGAAPDAEHASWCLATEDLELDDDTDDTDDVHGDTVTGASDGGAVPRGTAESVSDDGGSL
jgi:hypothetical protein